MSNKIRDNDDVRNELYRLASLVGTDAKTPFTNLCDFLDSYVERRCLETEIKIHDEYWHSQRLVEENGIGPVALANKEATELDLRKRGSHE